MKVEYKVLFNRDKHNKTTQQQISKVKDYLNNTLKHTKHPYFVTIGFVGGGSLDDEQTSFNLTLFIDDDIKARYDLNKVILATFKGSSVYIFENNNAPHKLQ